MKQTSAQSDGGAERPLLMTSRQAAQMLAISERTLWALAASGEIPRVRVGRSIRYDIEDLRRFIAARKEGSR